MASLRVAIAESNDTAPSVAQMVADANRAAPVWEVDGKGAVRHHQSGVQCKAGAAAKAIIYLKSLTSHPANEPGNDVECAFVLTLSGRASQINLRVRRLNGRSSSQLFDELVADIRAKHPTWELLGLSNDEEAKRRTPQWEKFLFASDVAKPDWLSAMATSVWLSSASDWAVQVQSTYPEADEASAEFLSVIISAKALEEVKAHTQTK